MLHLVSLLTATWRILFEASKLRWRFIRTFISWEWTAPSASQQAKCIAEVSDALPGKSMQWWEILSIYRPDSWWQHTSRTSTFSVIGRLTMLREPKQSSMSWSQSWSKAKHLQLRSSNQSKAAAPKCVAIPTRIGTLLGNASSKHPSSSKLMEFWIHPFSSKGLVSLREVMVPENHLPSVISSESASKRAFLFIMERETRLKSQYRFILGAA